MYPCGQHVVILVRTCFADRHTKGVLAPLKAVASRLGATWLLEVKPQLVESVLMSMGDDAACQAGTSFLQELLRLLLAEMQASRKH